MKKNVEMISLNSTQSEFEEEMNLDARLQKLESNELKSVKAGESCPKMGCPAYVCPDMGCVTYCVDRCDWDCAIDCENCWDCYGYDDCRRMDPT